MAGTRDPKPPFLSAPHIDVDVLISGGGEAAAIDHCHGPDANGDCPRVAAGERVACAGRLLRLHGLPIDGWDVHVMDEATGCPLAWLLTRLSTNDRSSQHRGAEAGSA